MNLYEQLLPEGRTPVSQELEEATGSERAGGLDWRWVTGTAARKVSFTTRATYGPETERVRALVAVEQNLIADGKIQILDLTAPGETKPIEIFITQVHRRAEAIGLDLPVEIDRELREAWNQQRLDQRSEQISNLRGFVRVRADFTIRLEAGKFILKSVAGGEATEVGTVVLSCEREHVLPAGRTMFESGGDVRATCFGSIVRWNPEARTLTVLPIGIYS